MEEDWSQPPETILTTRRSAERGKKNRKQKWEEKQFYGRFKRLSSDISLEKTWIWLIKRNLKRETDSLLITSQNNAIRTNHIKARIDKTQQNSRCRLCGDRDETMDHMISECSKLLPKEYKTRHNWLGKVIHCKKTEGGARGVIVIVVGNEHGDTSSNPGRNSLHFT